MPNDKHQRRTRNEEDGAETTREDLADALEQLDRAAARVRQLVYRIRPMLRDEEPSEEGARSEERRPVRGRFRRPND